MTTLDLSNELIIESDGTSMGTKLKTKSGLELLGVRRLEFTVDAKENLAKVVIMVDMAVANIQLTEDKALVFVVTEHHCPDCRKIVKQPGLCHDCFINRVAP